MAVKFRRGAWYADFYDAHGTRRQLRFRTKDEAQVAQARGTLEAQQKIVPHVDPGITLEAYAKRWLSEGPARGLKPGTIERYDSALRLHILPLLGRMRVRAVTRPAVKAALSGKLLDESASQQGVRPGRGEKRAAKALARGTVRHLLSALMAIMSSAVEDQIITANPLARLGKKLRLTARRKGQKVKALDAEQTGRFLAAARAVEPRHYPMFATMAWAGLRIGEALALQAAKIDFDRRTLLVDAQLGGTTKTETPRTVDLAATLVELLRAVKAPPAGKVVALQAPGPWLFFPELPEAPSAKDEARLYKATRRAMVRALKAAGLPGHFTPHSLRHSYGSLLISAGVSPAYVQQQMGHASISMTVDVYGSWLPVRSAGAVDHLAASTNPDGDRSVTFEASEARKSLSGHGA